MYNDIPAELLRVVEPVVRDHGLELVDAGVHGGGGRAVVRIVVDTPAGDGKVNVDRCAEVSREVGRGLDVAEVVRGSYMLEVTSPGIDRTLGREVDFRRSLGRKVSLETREPLDGRRRFKGELVAFDGSLATLCAGEERFDIPFARISRARAFWPGDAASGQGKG